MVETDAIHTKFDPATLASYNCRINYLGRSITAWGVLLRYAQANRKVLRSIV